MRANRGVRPADMVNGLKMVQPLRSMESTGESINLMRLGMDLFTRLEVAYQPYDGSSDPGERVGSGGLVHVRGGEPRVGLFVDSPDHLSGVALTLGEWAGQARARKLPFTLHSCGEPVEAPDQVVFRPMGSIRLDAYAGLKVNVPKVEDVLRYIDRMAFDVIHVSTPGPMGLLGVMAARHRGLPVCGTYHTDFPAYARTLSGDGEMEEIGWKVMRWFYGQLDRVAAPTETVRRNLIAHGFAAENLAVVGRGVKTSAFHPRFRSREWRAQWGGDRRLKLLYVGRISKEKNLETLVGAFRQLNRTRPDLSLVVVGDGPYRAEMEGALAGLPVSFTGVLHGQDLATAFASCDVFVFPSRTDTYGRVVLEAQASGLPVVVSDEGGPKDAMVNRVTGDVIAGVDEIRLAETINRLTDDPARLVQMRQAARKFAEARTPEASFEAFWTLHREMYDPKQEPQQAEVNV